MKIVKLFLVLVLILSASHTYSQIGVRAGINIASQNFDEDINIDQSPIIGLNFGITYELVFSERFSIQPELHYIQKGFKYEFDGFIGSTSISFSLNYLELALLNKYTIADIGNDGGLYLGFIPYVGFGLNGKSKFEFLGESETEDVEFDDELKRIDLGLGFGMGASFGNFYLDFRYNHGLVDISDESILGGKNRGLLIGVGYKF